MRQLALILALIAAAVPAEGAQVLFAHGHWAAIDFGKRCEARTRAYASTGQARPTGYAGFAFDAEGPADGQFYAHLSRPAREGSTVMLTVGGEPFLLAGRGDWAWSRSGAQRDSIIAAARASGGMRLQSRDGGGRRFSDRYVLEGAATAIDSAAAACAGKSH